MFSLFFICLAMGALQLSDSTAGPGDLTGIRAFLRIDESLATSGMLSAEDIGRIESAGYEVVINLAPAHPERNYLEGYRIAEKGMTYVHIPVSWDEPALRDLRQFFDVMDSNSDRKVFVHCNANMRVSAFVYLYRVLRRAVPEAAAKRDLLKIWDPDEQPQWKAFLEAAQKE